MASGSSPLARGLRDVDAEGAVRVGIIPARAGFTGFCSAWAPPGSDHPRSRGVYAPIRSMRGMGAGSSPLARGLLRAKARRPVMVGIIPARAGFTVEHERDHRRGGDHPRSRGVYRRSLPPGPDRRGSSPLARGLQHHQPKGTAMTGIIPARAGFTIPSFLGRFFTTDHPRSRGVYSISWCARGRSAGSSPLARGLLACGWPPERWTRIIPARAGFTVLWDPVFLGAEDHPRSRGVYSMRSPKRIAGLGSSPLARGLLVVRSCAVLLLGIIPARAGFTTGPLRPCSAAWDHPRSRGVYSRMLTSSRPVSGSSPLARGLLVGRFAPDWDARIIPARAGFTALLRRVRARSLDHPRSRGVYTTPTPIWRTTWGSSPLARGLPGSARPAQSE